MSAEDGRDPQSRLSGLSVGAMAGRLGKLARDPAIRGIASVFVMKSSIIVANFTLIMLAARVLDTEHFGVFSILFSAAGLFCIVATFGQQVSIMRWWNEYTAAGDPGMLKGVLRFSLAACLIGCAIVAAGFYYWATANHTVLLAVAVTLYMVSQALVLTSSHLVRTAISVGAGDGYGNLLVVMPALLYLAASLAIGGTANVSTVFFLFSAGALAAMLLHFVFLWQKVHALYPDFASVKPRYDGANWRSRSFKLWISNGLEAANQYLDVLIIGYLMSPAVAGAYFVTTRLANAFATASDTMHMFSTRHIPDLYYRGEFKQLNSLLNSVAGITLATVVVGMIVILAGGQFFLMVFNEAYVPYYPALALLCFGTAAIAAAGPSGSILMLTGHEGRYLKIVALTVLIRAVGFFTLIPGLGIMGAVSATTISFIFMAAMLRHSSKTLTGLDGSVARLIGARNRPAYASPANDCA